MNQPYLLRRNTTNHRYRKRMKSVVYTKVNQLYTSGRNAHASTSRRRRRGGPGREFWLYYNALGLEVRLEYAYAYALANFNQVEQKIVCVR